TDQNLPTFLNWSDGWRGSRFNNSKLASASFWIDAGKASYPVQNRGDAECFTNLGIGPRDRPQSLPLQGRQVCQPPHLALLPRRSDWLQKLRTTHENAPTLAEPAARRLSRLLQRLSSAQYNIRLSCGKGIRPKPVPSPGSARRLPRSPRRWRGTGSRRP